MKRFRDEFLTSTTLTKNENTRVGRCDLLQLLHNAMHRGARADDAFEAEPAVDEPLQLIHDQLMACLLLTTLHPAKPYMAEVFDPFEIADRNPPGVGIEIGDDHGALLAQDLIGARGDGAIGGLDDQGCSDRVGIAKIYDTLQSGRNEDIAFGLKHL